MNLAHGVTVLHGDDVVTFVMGVAVAALVLGGLWLMNRRRDRRSSER